MNEWRAIPGYEGYYEVSSDGRVRSVERITTHGRLRRAQEIAQCRVRAGYLAVQLNRDGAALMRFVAGLVAEAFIGPRPAGMDVCHNDGDKTNNRLENLRYDTRAANQADRLLHDTHCIGERSPNARLTWGAVDEIRKSADSDASLASRFGVSRRAIWSVRAGKSWPAGFAK